jgi:hypothetical protein
MRRFHWLALASVLALLGTVTLAQQPAAKPAAPPTPAAPPRTSAKPVAPNRASGGAGYDLVGSIREIMQSIVDPSSDFLFDSVAVSITAAGTKETAPKTDEEWAAVRHQALTLAEAGNLLKIPGRRVQSLVPIPGAESETPGPEDLTPEQVQALLNRTRPDFNNFAQKLTDAAMIALRAVDKRDVDGLFDAGDSIDTACENCHLMYWYPGEKKPDAADLSRRNKK